MSTPKRPFPSATDGKTDSSEGVQQTPPEQAVQETPPDEGLQEAPPPKGVQEAQPDKGVLEAPQIDKGLQEALQLDKGVQEAPQLDKGVQETPQPDKGIQEAPQLDKEVQETPQPDKHDQETTQPDMGVQEAPQLDEGVQEATQPDKVQKVVVTAELTPAKEDDAATALKDEGSSKVSAEDTDLVQSSTSEILSKASGSQEPTSSISSLCGKEYHKLAARFEEIGEPSGLQPASSESSDSFLPSYSSEPSDETPPGEARPNQVVITVVSREDQERDARAAGDVRPEQEGATVPPAAQRDNITAAGDMRPEQIARMPTIPRAFHSSDLRATGEMRSEQMPRMPNLQWAFQARAADLRPAQVPVPAPSDPQGSDIIGAGDMRPEGEVPMPAAPVGPVGLEQVPRDVTPRGEGPIPAARVGSEQVPRDMRPGQVAMTIESLQSGEAPFRSLEKKQNVTVSSEIETPTSPSKEDKTVKEASDEPIPSIPVRFRRGPVGASPKIVRTVPIGQIPNIIPPHLKRKRPASSSSSEASGRLSSSSKERELQLLSGEDYLIDEEKERLQESRLSERSLKKEKEQIREFLATLSPFSSKFSIEQMSPNHERIYKEVKLPGAPRRGRGSPHMFITATPRRTMERVDRGSQTTSSASPLTTSPVPRSWGSSPVHHLDAVESPSIREDSTRMEPLSPPGTGAELPTRRDELAAKLPGPSIPSVVPPPDEASGAKPRESLRELMARRRRELREEEHKTEPEDPGIHDPYANSTASKYIIRGKTGIVYDKEMLKHKCEWDAKHPENPQRLYVVIDKCYDRGLLDMCETIPNLYRTDVYARIMAVHTAEHYEKLKSISQLPNYAAREEEAAKYDSVYFNESTFDAACRAASSTLNLVLAVARHDVMNGMAFVRPPGHHAMEEEYNGYCFFNNVAIAAEACIRDGLKKKILIVDIDVHHGQGTQRMFYDRKDVLYFSIHRYEHGCFWPYLKESNFNYIGKGEGLGYNINVPLNTTGLSDGDYLAIIMQILLPVGYEFNPDLVIVSAGYDAVVGCPEGRMNVTPGFYCHLVQLLHGLARGNVAVVLEGGYFLPTLSEGACLTLKTLLGGPCPRLEPVHSINPSVIETITCVKRSLYGKWKCFEVCEMINAPYVADQSDKNTYKVMYYGQPDMPPYLTRGCYPENTIPDYMYHAKLNKALCERYRAPVSLPVKFVYHDDMLKHEPQQGDIKRPERPNRLTAIMNVFKEFGLDNRLLRTPIVFRPWNEYSPHIPGYFERINTTLPQHKDLFVNAWTQEAVNIAVNGLLTLADNVVEGKSRSGVGIVRPPGHHAEHDRPMGFCFVNNVAVLADYLHVKYNLEKILIVDFDIHHGNGTQNMFYTSPHVLYISIHKDNHGKFFPPNSERSHKHDGHGPGKGYNINVPFNKDVMGDTEYLATFHNVVLPAAYAYCPQFVIVSAGFDAGINDLLGGYNVNPETFGHMILMLKTQAEGKMIIALEGGYNKTTTAYGMAICSKALLGDPIIMPKNLYESFSTSAINTIRDVTSHFSQFFNIFQCNRRLPVMPLIVKVVSKFTTDQYSNQLTRILDPERIDDNDYVESEMRALNLSAC